MVSIERNTSDHLSDAPNDPRSTTALIAVDLAASGLALMIVPAIHNGMFSSRMSAAPAINGRNSRIELRFGTVPFIGFSAGSRRRCLSVQMKIAHSVDAYAMGNSTSVVTSDQRKAPSHCLTDRAWR